MSDPTTNNSAPDVTPPAAPGLSARDQALTVGPPPPPTANSHNAYAGSVVLPNPYAQNPAPGPDSAGFSHGQASAPAPVFLPKIYRSPRYPIILGATAAVTFIGMVLNIAFSAEFPNNAPIELFLSAALSLDLALATITLVIFALVFAFRRTVYPPRTLKVDGLAIAAVSCGVVALIGWSMISGPALVSSLVTGERGRYDGNVSGAWVAGIPWALAFVFGAIGFRRGTSRVSTILAAAGLLCGLLVLVPVLASSFIYGLGLSD